MTKSIALLVGLSIAITTLSAGAQAPGATPPAPAFEVASVKPNTSGEFGGSFGYRPGGQFVVVNNTLRNMIRNAYGVQNFQIVGGPDWLDKDRFDVMAKAPTGDLAPAELRLMVQALLADRFGVVAHKETRELPIYAIVQARSDARPGPQLRRSEIDCAAIAAAAARGGPPPAAPNGLSCGTRTSPGRLSGRGVTLADLARNLSNFAGRTTVDKSGLTGAFDLDLEWTPDQPPPEGLPASVPKAPENGASLFAALQEQLGLKLDSQRGPVEVLVIDSAQRPTPD